MPHVVYCLTSSGCDIYEAITRISLNTVRLSNPHCKITVAADQTTYNSLHECKSNILHEADSIVNVPSPDGEPVFRNRFVKTQLGEIIQGPFLYLDSDTVVRKSLNPLLKIDTDIAAATNHSRDGMNEQIWISDLGNLSSMGWKFNHPYFNGGVIWYGGTDNSRLFARTWHNYWLLNVKKRNWLRDQTAFNTAIHKARIKLVILQHCWNAQIDVSPKETSSAVVWHLYLTKGHDQMYQLTRDAHKLMHKSHKDPLYSAQKLTTSTHPWTNRSIIDGLLAKRVIKTNYISDTCRAWFSKDVFSFLAWKVKNESNTILNHKIIKKMRLKQLVVFTANQ